MLQLQALQAQLMADSDRLEVSLP
jgi:hypothetical protein